MGSPFSRVLFATQVLHWHSTFLPVARPGAILECFQCVKVFGWLLVFAWAALHDKAQNFFIDETLLFFSSLQLG